MEYSNKELFKISKAVFTESILHSQLEASGSNKAKFLENLGKKKKRYFGAQSIAMKCLIALYMVIFTLIPVLAFIQINVFSNVPYVEDTWNLFAGGLTISGFMALQLIILLIFSVTFTWGFLSKEPYTWVSTLPFSRKDIGKISFFTFLRGIDVQLIVLSLVLPIATIIGINLPRGLGVGVGRNFLMIAICLVVNLSNTMFNISIVILLGRKMAKVMEDQEENNKLASLIRIGTMLAYVLFTMLASYGIQLAIGKIPLLFDPANQFISTQTADIVITILSFIPFPFAGGFLLTSAAIGFTRVPLMVIIGSSIGSVLQICLAILVFRKAMQILQGITSYESKTKNKQKTKKKTKIEIKISRPTSSYFRRDIALITRELQMIVYMILPIMIPISTALAYPMNGVIGSTGIPAMIPYIMSFAIFSTFFVITGVTSIETGGETITASLPIKIRDQIKAKIPFLFSLVPIMVLAAVLLQIKKDIFIDTLLMATTLLPAIFIAAMFGLFLKIRLFGKLKHKYVLEEVNIQYKELKIISIILAMFVLTSGFIFALLVGYWLTLMLEGICLILLLVTYFVMFKEKR